MALDSLVLNGQAGISWTAQKNVTGASANNNSSSVSEAKASLGTAAAGNAANGLNELYFAVLSIAASGNATQDFTSFTDILNATAVVGARIKFIQVGLLSTTQDAVNGTNAASITIDGTATNGFVSQGTNPGWLLNATSGFAIPNGGWVQFGCTNANGVVVDATHKVLKINNIDAGVAAAVKVVVGVSTV